MNKRDNHDIKVFLKAMNKKYERRLRNYKRWPKDMLLDEEIRMIDRL